MLTQNWARELCCKNTNEFWKSALWENNHLWVFCFFIFPVFPGKVLWVRNQLKVSRIFLVYFYPSIHLPERAFPSSPQPHVAHCFLSFDIPAPLMWLNSIGYYFLPSKRINKIGKFARYFYFNGIHNELDIKSSGIPDRQCFETPIFETFCTSLVKDSHSKHC